MKTFLNNLHTFETNTAWKESEFGVFLVRMLNHKNYGPENSEYKHFSHSKEHH